MGNYETPLELEAGMIFELPGGLFIAASAADIERLRSSPMIKNFAGATMVPIDADAELPAEISQSAKVVVLEVDPTSSESLRRIAKLRAEREDLPIIAALARADVSLVRTLIRQGISDVAELPFAPEELASQILDATSRLAEHAPQGALAPMFTVARSTGGSGATTLVTHLAAELARLDQTGRGVCVVDLDLQSGDVGAFLGLEPKVTVSALFEAGDRLDGDLVRSAVVETNHGFSLIAAPDAIAPLDTVDVDQLLKVLSYARRHFGYVVVDLPADWTNWSLSTVVSSTSVLLVTDLSIASLRQARRRLDLLRSVGLSKQQLKVVANRMERRLFKAIGVNEVGEALDCEVAATLTADSATVRSAQDQGLLVGDIAAKNRLVLEIRALAAELVKAGS